MLPASQCFFPAPGLTTIQNMKARSFEFFSSLCTNTSYQARAALRRLHHKERVHVGVHRRQVRGFVFQVLEQDGAQVALAKVWDHHHNQLAGILFTLRQLYCLCYRCTARNAEPTAVFVSFLPPVLHAPKNTKARSSEFPPRFAQTPCNKPGSLCRLHHKERIHIGVHGRQVRGFIF